MKQIIRSIKETNLEPVEYWVGKTMYGFNGVTIDRIELEKTHDDLVKGDIYVGYDKYNNKIFEIPKGSVMVFYEFENKMAVEKE